MNIKGKITYVNKKLEEITGFSREEILGKSMLNLAQGVVSRESMKLIAGRVKRRLIGKATKPIRLPLVHKQTGDKIWVEAESKAIKRFGIPVGVQAIMRDVTELMEAEESLKHTFERLETLNEKLGVVGKLTRHDARNKLSAVTMNAFLAKQKLVGDQEGLKYLSEIESAVGQVEEMHACHDAFFIRLFNIVRYNLAFFSYCLS